MSDQHLARFVARRPPPTRLAKRTMPPVRSHAQLLESRGVDPATKRLTIADAEKLDPVLARAATVTTDGTIDTSIKHLARHFVRMAPDLAKATSHQIGTHLLHHFEAELPAEPDPNMRDWYGPHSRAAEYGFHKLLGYPNDQHDPKQIIAKMILAITSNNAHPNLHYGTTIRILRQAGGDPAKISPTNDAALDRFRAGMTARGVEIPSFRDQAHAAVWARDNAAAINAAGKGEDVGYYGAPVHIRADGTIRIQGKGERFTGAHAYAPLLKHGLEMEPKRWSGQESVGKGIVKLRHLIDVMGVKAAARFLVDHHHPDTVRKMGRLKDTADVTVDYLPHTGSTPGSFMFGPKIGSFFQNIHGDEKYMTADRWLGYLAGRAGMPGVFGKDKAGRATGGTPWGKTKVAKANRALLYHVLTELIKRNPEKLRSHAQAQAIFWGPEQEIANQYTEEQRVPGNFRDAADLAIKRYGGRPLPAPPV